MSTPSTIWRALLHSSASERKNPPRAKLASKRYSPVDPVIDIGKCGRSWRFGGFVCLQPSPVMNGLCVAGVAVGRDRPPAAWECFTIFINFWHDRKIRSKCWQAGWLADDAGGRNYRFQLAGVHRPPPKGVSLGNLYWFFMEWKDISEA